MTEHKFTDDEIIRALECCYTNDSNDCYKCPYTAESTAEMFCDKKLQKDALDLINRQKAESERLQEMLDATIAGQETLQKAIDKKNAEIEGLKDLNSQLETDIINANMNLEHITYEFDLLNQEKSVVVAKAVKEFAERLKTYYRNLDKTAGALIEYHIDQIAKEMLEGG